MPIDLVAAVVAWLVGASGDSGIRLLRGPRDARALSKAMDVAIAAVANQVNSESRRTLERGLHECFSSPPRLPIDVSVPVGEGLRAAIEAQLSLLSQSVNNDTGVPFYRDVGLEPDWLTRRFTDAVIGAIRHVVAAGGLPALANELVNADISARLDALDLKVSELRVSTPAAVTRTLPHNVDTFTGRKSDFEALMRAVTGADVGGVVGIYAIDGMAGVGKTAFAIHAAHRLASEFPDRQLFVSLHGHTPGQRPVQPSDALAALLRDDGVTAEQIPDDVDARVRLWRDRVAGLKLLLVLDDAASHEQVRPLLPGSPNSLVLVTSRRHLTALEDTVSFCLDTLPPDDAAHLFTRLVARPGLPPENPSVADIVRLCAYLPLAIRLMAGRAASHPTWTIPELAADLAAAENRLTLMRAENTSATAAFDLSYKDLTSHQRRFFRRLGLHPGPDIYPYAAAALDAIDVAEARRCLDDLYDQHLLDEPGRGRYRFHDLIREHARALSASDPPTESDAAVDRLLDYYLSIAAGADQLARETSVSSPTSDQQMPPGPDIATLEDALSWFEAERLNLAAAIEYSATHRQSGIVTRLSRAMSFFITRRGYWDQALSLHEVALTCGRASGDPCDQASILNDLGRVQMLKGQHATALASLAEALDLSRNCDQVARAETLRNLGGVQYLTRDYPVSIANLTEALTIYRAGVSGPAEEADTLGELGSAQYESGDITAALYSWKKTLELQRELGRRLGQADALTGIGCIQIDQKEYVAAASSLDEAVALFRNIHDLRGEATVLIDIGGLKEETEEYAAAAASFEEALLIFRLLGSPLGQAKALWGRALVHYKAGEDASAHSLLRNALRLVRDIGDREFEDDILRFLGRLGAA